MLAIGFIAAGSACDAPDKGDLLGPAAASAAVSELLYEKNLISDPAVMEEMNEQVLRVSRDGLAADSVLPGFHRWLVRWAAENPDRVAAAWVASAPYRAAPPTDSGRQQGSLRGGARP